MQARPFRLLNATECAKLAGDAGDALAQWMREWGDRRADAALEAPVRVRDASRRVADAGTPASPAGALSWSGADGTVHLPDAGHARHWAACALGARAEDAPPPPGSLAAELVERALGDLARRLAGSALVPGSAPPPASSRAPGCGAASIGLPSAAGELDVVLDAALVSHRLAGLARPARKEPAPADPRGGLGSLPVEIRAWLGSAEVDVAVLHTLAVGDVVVLDGRLDQPLRVSVAGRAVAARAWLGHAGERKAVRLAGGTPRQ